MKKEIKICLTEEEKEKLKYLAEREHRSMSNYIETVLKRYVENKKKEISPK